MTTDVVIAAPPRQRRGGVLEYISPSRLNLWLRCPLAFRLRYIDGIPTPTTSSLLVGKVVHAGLEYWYRHVQLDAMISQEEVRQHVAHVWREAVASENVRFKNEAEEARLENQVGELVMTYLRDVPPDDPRPLAVEARLEMPLVCPWSGEDLGIPLLGIIDLVLDGSDGATVIDFKTAANGAAPNPLAHEIQLSIYAYLLRAASGRTEGELQIRSLIKTKVPKLVIHQYPPRQNNHLQRLFAVIREYLDAIGAQRYNYRPSWMCGMCDYCGRQCARWSG